MYPVMHNFLSDMKALNLQNRTFALIENGTWACNAGNVIQKFITEELKGCTVIENRLKIMSSMLPDKAEELSGLADSIIASVKE